MKAAIILALLAGISFSSAQAQNHLGARTRQGVRSGEITPRERAVIAHQRQDVRVARNTAHADGVVTPGERRVIQHEKRQASRTIYRAKHNNRHR